MSGIQRQRRWAWVMATLLAVLSAPAATAPRVALVIGNAAYDHAPALANPLNDAADMGAALGRLGFSVTRLDNADRASLWRGLQEFALAASASEVAVVFYAGHGIEVDQRNFLVPVDARLASDQDVEFEAVPLELVSRSVARASGLRLVILDACRENPFAVSMQRAGATRSIGRGLARVEPSGETLIAYAAKEGTVASDGAGRNSPFSEALLGHLEEPGLEVMFMFRKVRDAVLASTGGRQEPFMYGSLSSQGVYLAAVPVTEPASSQQPSASDESGSSRVTAERELLFWESVKDSGHPADIQLYLDRYPGGIYEALARNRVKRLGDVAERPAAPASPVPATPAQESPSIAERMAVEKLAAEREFWVSIKGSDDPADIQAYLDRYPDGAYEVLARNRLERLKGGLAEPEPPTPSADPAPAPTPSSTRVEAERLAAEREFWASVKASEDTAELQAYLDRYPDGEYAVLARRRLKRLEETAASEPSVPTPTQPTAPTPAVPTPEEVESSLGLERTKRTMVQGGLASLGHAPGPADGLFGSRTRTAIRRYQTTKGFETTGYLTAEQSQALVALGEEAARAEAERRKRERAEAERRKRERAEAAQRRETMLDSITRGLHVSSLAIQTSVNHIKRIKALKSLNLALANFALEIVSNREYYTCNEKLHKPASCINFYSSTRSPRST